jgi:hypothetical protein
LIGVSDSCIKIRTGFRPKDARARSHTGKPSLTTTHGAIKVRAVM